MRVIVVGNGGDSLTDNDGARIDSFEYVVRCNEAWKCFGPKFGSRTDALAVKVFDDTYSKWCAANNVELWGDRQSKLAISHGARVAKQLGKRINGPWFLSRGFNACAMAIEKLNPDTIVLAACEGLMGGQPRATRKVEQKHWSTKYKQWKVTKHYWAEERLALAVLSEETRTEIISYE